MLKSLLSNLIFVTVFLSENKKQEREGKGFHATDVLTMTKMEKNLKQDKTRREN
jgi:hypothetical protein